MSICFDNDDEYDDEGDDYNDYNDDYGECINNVDSTCSHAVPLLLSVHVKLMTDTVVSLCLHYASVTTKNLVR